MGLKKFFKIKPPPEDTPEQNREMLGNLGVTVKNPNKQRTEKFAAYGQFARDRGADKFYAPEGYEQYAKPPEQQPETMPDAGDDLNQSIIGTDAQPQREKTHKKSGLFGRKKSSEHNENVAMEQSNESPYDPYAVSTDLNAAPYGATENKYGSSFNNADPYSRSNDPYGSSYSSNNNDPYSIPGDPYGSKNNSTSNNSDPYSSNNDPYSANNDPYSSNNLYSKVNRQDLLNNSNPYANKNGLDSYNNTQPQQSNSSFNQSSNNNNAPLSSDTGRSVHPYESGRISSANSRRNPSSNPYNTRSSLKKNVNNAASTTASSAAMAAQATSNAYSNDNNSRSKSNTPVSNGNPYGSMSNTAYNSSNNTLNPYESMSANPYGSSTDIKNNPYGGPNTTSANPYGNNSSTSYNTGTNVYTLNRANTTFTERGIEPTNNNNGLMEVMYDNKEANDAALNSELDLNATIDEYNKDTIGDDLNADLNQRIQEQQFAPQQTFMQEQNGNPYDQVQREEESRGFKTFEEVQREEEEKQQREEEEAVDELKQQIRFTKQSSVASTRNTLRMAQEAENAGMNTLGMLGHQSEKLNNVERNLDLIKIQNSVADDKVEELKKLNRNILAVHVSNPFNSNRRRRQREEAIKNKKIEEHIMMEATNNELTRSTNRIENAMNANMNSDSGIRERYQRQKVLNNAKKYQFENDEEDNEMEIEIDRNLEQIGQISSRLKKMAISTGEELDAQQARLNNIENSTDDLDIKIHINTTKLSTIK